MGTNRLESFSDGVMAVAITLLVLDIVPPTLEASAGRGLLYELGQNWPHYIAYVISFMTIGIIWINHHAMISRLREADHSILILNLVLLMTIAVLPFATELMADYLRADHGQKLAAGVYSGAFLVMALAFSALNRHILLARAHMLSAEIPLEERRRILSRSVSGVAPYLVATVLAVLSAYASLAVCAALALYYAFPLASGGTVRRQ
ncbi:MAG TPA: TMEM175 family protein [Solirubrobacteraceae bacterium]|nr:TMEM175 family protein [Solirubrobacteraceae bacterium]